MPRIPEHKIEEVRLASDIVEVVGEYVQLKRAGTRWVGLCPFHNEKTPSFGVTPSMQIYKCFGCGKAGNVFSFLMEHDNVGFVEAVRVLADRANIPLPELEGPADETASETDSVYHALRFAARHFYEQLTQTDAGREVGLSYFGGRGFEPKTIKQFGLGFAPDEWRVLMDKAKTAHIEDAYLERAGLIIVKDNGNAYDRFRGRVIFPLFSHVGKVLGFAGRVLEGSNEGAKYINSPETEVYHKSRVLYGLYQGKNEIRRASSAMLVEGYTDVISLHQAGLKTAVASSGTALTAEQVAMLKRYAKTIHLLYDADNAGTNAALRGLDLVLEADLEVRIVPLPDGADPDSFVRQFGGEAFRNFVKEHEQDFVTFIVGVARRRGQLGTPEGVLETVRDVLSSIARIPSPIKQDGYIRIAADELDIPEVQLRPEMQKVLERREKSRRVEERASRRVEERSRGVERQRDRAAQDALADYMMPEYTEEPPPLRPSAPTSPIVPLPEKKLVELMLAHGDRMVELILSNMGLAEFTEGPSLQVVEQLVAMYEAGAVSREPFLQGTHGPAVQTFVADVLMLEKERVSGNWRQMHQIEVPEIDEDPKKSAISSMRLLRMHRIDEAAKRLRRQTARARQDQDTQAELRYAQEAVQLQRELQRVKSGAFPDIDA